MQSDQTTIFNLGRKMLHEPSYLDRLFAEGELIQFVKNMVTEVEKREELLNEPKSNI